MAAGGVIATFGPLIAPNETANGVDAAATKLFAVSDTWLESRVTVYEPSSAESHVPPGAATVYVVVIAAALLVGLVPTACTVSGPPGPVTWMSPVPMLETLTAVLSA